MQPTANVSNRSGVTLTEVLTSILIMALGVTFVISLFPVAMLRSLRASQLTNAALTRLNAEATIDLLPGIIHDPNGDENSLEHFRFQNERNYIIDPWGYAVHWSDASPAAGVGPSPRVGSYRDWFGNVGAPPTLGGNANDASPNGYPTGLPTLPRFDGGLYRQLFGAGAPTPAAIAQLEREAAALVGSRDGWVDHIDVEVTSSALFPSPAGPVYGVTLAGADFDSLPTDPTTGFVVDSRIVIYNDLGRVSAAYPITSVDSGTGVVSWSEDVNANGVEDAGEDRNGNGEFETRALSDQFRDDSLIPPEFSASRVVLEVSRARHYSWMLSVRKGTDGQAGVDVVVVFNRGVDPENERVFPATFVAQTNQVLVSNSGGVEPKLQQGGFVLDTQNARWYRVQGIDEPPLVGAWDYGTYDYALRVERTVINQAGEDRGTFPNGTLDAGEDLDGDGAIDFGGAIFMPGVIEVYPLGTKTLPESAL